MGKILKDIFVNMCSNAFSTWWGGLMTISVISSFGTWLSSKTPILSEYAPFSYFLCFCLSLLMGACLILKIREIIFSGTTKRTFIELEITNEGMIEITRRKSNINDYVIHRNMTIQGTTQMPVTEIFVVFSHSIRKPITHITEKIAVNPVVLTSYSSRSCAVVGIAGIVPLGKFCIDFNDENIS